MKITIIITAILFLYVAFSTLFPETALAGNIGKMIGEGNVHLFGYLAYVNVFILFYPLYKLYSDVRTRKELDFYLGWILFFIALVIFEALVLAHKDAGYLGTQVVEFLQPFIGTAGLWLFLLMVLMLSLVFILDDDFSFTTFTEKTPKKKLSFSWLSKSGSLLKKVFKNPFSSPRLEDEMMPAVVEKPKKRVAAKRKPSVKKAVPARKLKTAPIVEEDAVINEIFELENDMSCSSENGTVANTTNSNVKIVSELEENSKLMQEIDKGVVAKPKN
ncbi:MAG: DNA translocase FtsK, partial [Sulfurovum sp.]|nr:DNA translocase FtsK [Sulfurovum sp.]